VEFLVSVHSSVVLYVVIVCVAVVWQNLANDAEKMWAKMVNVNDQDIRLPHDGYLKLWQLRRPQLEKYDVLMIDEAQDLTPGSRD